MDGTPVLTRVISSAPAANPAVSDRLPEEVVACLQNARFLHLATCTGDQPHVSLMNYTYLAPHTRPRVTANHDGIPTTTNSRGGGEDDDSAAMLPAGPAIIMTSNPGSKKTANLLANRKVSLLVHDWVSSRPPNMSEEAAAGGASGGGAGAQGRRAQSPGGRASSSLANMLMSMNSAAVSSISATMNGDATVLEPGSAAERWCKEMHLANNTPAGGVDGMGAGTVQQGDGGRGCYIEDQDVRVVVVGIRDGRISDWKGGVKDWVIRGEEGLADGV